MKKSILILIIALLIFACDQREAEKDPFVPGIDMTTNNSQYNISILQCDNGMTAIYLQIYPVVQDYVSRNLRMKFDDIEKTREFDFCDWFSTSFPKEIPAGQEVEVELHFDRCEYNENLMIELIDEHYSYEDWRNTAEVMATVVGRNDATMIDEAEDGDERLYNASHDSQGWIIDSTVEPDWQLYFAIDNNHASFYSRVIIHDRFIFGWDSWQEEYQSVVNQEFGGDEVAFWEAQLLDNTRTRIDPDTGDEIEYQDKDFDFENGFHTEWAASRSEVIDNSTTLIEHKDFHFFIKKPYSPYNVEFPQDYKIPGEIRWEVQADNMLQFITLDYQNHHVNDFRRIHKHLPGEARSWTVSDSVEFGDSDRINYFLLQGVNFYRNVPSELTAIYNCLNDRDYHVKNENSLDERYSYDNVQGLSEELFNYINTMEGK